MDQDGAVTPRALPGPRGLGWLLLLFFVSGMSGLMYEIVWLRKLTLIFGNTAFAVSTVLACFMAGLGFGSLWFGRIVERHPRRAVMIYVWLEVGIGVYGLLSLPLLGAFEPLYIAIYRSLGAGYYAMSLVRLACAFVVLLPATVLMGATLPVLCRHFVRDRESLASTVAKFYGANTLGAMLGCFAASFIVIAAVGVSATVVVAAALNFAAALGAWGVSRWAGTSEQDEPAAPAADAPIARAIEYPHWRPRWFVFIIAMTGFCGLAYEAFWTRLLGHVVGLDVQAFGLMLTTLLLGIGVGSALVTACRPMRENPLPFFIAIEILLGAAAMAALPVFEHIGRISWAMYDVVGMAHLWQRTVVQFGKCVVLMLAPSVLMGAAFPLAAALHARGAQGAGRRVGAAYAANTFGAIAGSLASGFILMPLVGVNASLMGVGLLNVAVGLSLVRSCPALLTGFRGRGLLLLLVLIAACSVVYAWPASKRPPVFSKKAEQEVRIRWQGEDLSGSVTVLENRMNPRNREVNINGLSVAYTDYDDVCVQKLLAHLPLLLHPAPKDVLIIGFGSGSTSGTTMLYPVQTECVELQKLEMVTAKYFTDLNHNVLSSDRFKVHIDDGRNFLLMTEKRYDVVSRDTLTPKESQDLFSVEFYELCKARLRPGGIVCGFLPTNIVPTADYFKLLVRSFLAAFPHGSVWYIGPNCSLLLGTVEPLQIDYNELVRRMAIPGIRADLAKIRYEDPAVFLSRLIAAGDQLKAFAGHGRIATDDRPLGFSFDGTMLRFSEGDVLTEDMLRFKEPAAKYLVNVGKDKADRAAILARLAKAEQAARLLIEGRQAAWRRDYGRAFAAFEKASAIFPDDRSIPYQDGAAAWELCQNIMRAGPSKLRDALAMAQRAVEKAPELAEPFVAMGQIYERMGQFDKALEAYRKSLKYNPDLVPPKRRLEALKRAGYGRGGQ